MFGKFGNKLAAVTCTSALIIVMSSCGGDDSSSSNDTTTKVATVTAPNGEDPWILNPTWLGMVKGDTGVLDCPAGGALNTVWGDKTYTSDSSICSAAVYEGIITAEAGGLVEFNVTEGEDSYDSGEANGVTTQSYDSWDLSFVLVK